MRSYSIVVRYAPDLDAEDQAADSRVVETALRIARELGARAVVVNELDTLTGEARPIGSAIP